MSRYRQKINAFLVTASMLLAAVLTAFLTLRTSAATLNLSSTLDLRSRDSITNNSYGYAWDEETKTLTLTNFSMVLNTAKDTAIHLPAGSTIYLPEGTKNEIVLPENEIILESFYGVRGEGDLTIEGAGSLSINLAQSATRLYGISTKDGNLTIDGCCVNVETTVSRLPETKNEANNRSIAIIASGGESIFSARNGATVFAFSGGINQTKAEIGGNIDAYGISASKVTVENATVFGKVDTSTNAGTGSVITAGVRAGTISIVESGAVTAQNQNAFSNISPALWGTVERTDSCIEQNVTIHSAEQYAQTDSAKPMSIGTEATFKTHNGKTYASPETLSSLHSEYTFLGWVDVWGNLYAGELGKTYMPMWKNGDVPLFYGSLDLSDNAPTQSDKDYGYAWNADTKTLTLSNFKLYAPEGGLGLVLPDGATVVCEANTISEIYAEGLTDKGINAAIYANGAVTFAGEGAIYAKGGKITQQEQLALTVAAGIYGSFTVDGPALHLFGGELSHPGSVGFYVPVGGKVVFEEGSLNAQGYGLGRAGMLSKEATFTASNKATIKAGNESADLVLDGFFIQNKEKYLSVCQEPQTDTNGGADGNSGFFTLGRTLLLVGFIGISVGAVAFLDSLKKRKASIKTSSQSHGEKSAQMQDENQSEK